MRSKLVKILFAMVAAFVALCTQAATETVNGIEWKYMVTEEGTAVIGSGEWCVPAIDESTSGAVIVPSTLGGCPVVEIGDDAFFGCSSITSVTIPDSVTSIGDSAFYYGYELTSVTIPNSVTKIGEYAFYDCSSLENLIIPDSVTSIGWGAFYYCELITNVVIPSNITHIPGYMFSGCYSLESVTIPDSVTSIGEGAFYECSSLTNAIIPRSVDTIDVDVFSGCLSLENIVVDSGNAYYKSVDGLLLSRDGSEIIACPGGKTDVTIPDNVLSIGEDAFSWCELLANVIIADSVMNIDEYAFVGCSSLTNITIPYSVVSIGVGAFAWCESLEEVLFERDRYEINVDFMSAFKGTPWLTSGDAFPPSTNDNFADAKILSGKAGCVRGSNVSATSETIEEGLGLGAATVWWKWIAPFSANTQFHTIGSDIDTLLGIFVLKDGLLTKVAFDDDDRIVDFDANAGTTYYIGVSGCDESQGFITLSWQQLIPPENDNFADAITLSGKAGSVEGSNIGASKEEFEDDLGFGTSTVWWKWTAPSSATMQFDTFGSEFDTMLGIYILDDGTLTEVTFNDDDEYGESEYCESRVKFNANAGTTYYIGISGYSDDQGDILLNWNISFDAFPLLGESATMAEVAAALEGSMDVKLVENINTAAEYAAFREWALNFDGVTPGEVKGSPNAWLSYALNTATLIAAAPKEGDIVIDTFESAATEGAFEFTVKIDGITVGENALEANIKKVFDIEGAEKLVSDGAGFSSDNVEINAVVPVNGNVKFTVTPKMGNGDLGMGNGEKLESFFFRVRMKQ